MEVVFVTGNPAKAEQLSRYLELPLGQRKLDLPEIQSLDLEAVVAAKARAAYAEVGKPVLVEDVALTFHALGRLPGPLIKWFLQELGNDGLCRMLDGYADRSARAEVLFGLYDGVSLQTFASQVEGSISQCPRGPVLFGWDVIFVPKGCTRTWAEMDEVEQAATSMRRPALEQLSDALKA